jgi:hypothetical protein
MKISRKQFIKAIGIYARTFCIALFFLMMNSQIEAKEKPVNRGDTIWFAGYKWVIKDSHGKHTGPGNNYFSSSKENVWIDADGKLHLRLTNRFDKWFCPEVTMVNPLGYGKYFFYVDPLTTPLDKELVVGLFLYDHHDSINYHREIDIEFSTWGRDTTVNTQYVVQPKESDAFRFSTDLNKKSMHMISTTKNEIHFRSYYIEDRKEKKYSSTKVKPEKEFYTDDEKVSLNVWLYNKVEPDNLKEFEIVFSSFRFEPGEPCKFPFIKTKKK